MRCIVLSAQAFDWPLLRGGLEASGLFTCLRRFEPVADADRLEGLIRQQIPHVVVMDGSSFPYLPQVREAAARVNPHIQLAAVGGNLSGDELLALMRNGVREYLPAPFGMDELSGPLTRLQQRVEASAASFSISEDLFVFLPAQAGVGATTLAVQSSLALAEDRKRKTLLVDLDLSNGLISYLLRLNNPVPLSEALSRDVELDEGLLKQLVGSRGRLDVTRSSEMQIGGRIEPARMIELLAAARRRYETICVDVSEAMEEHAVVALQEAREIFLVCTPQVQVLYLARKRMLELSRLGLAGRVRVIVNRAGSNAKVRPEQVADLLGVAEYLPVANDYPRVSEAWVSGDRIPPKTDLGRDIRALAAWMSSADIVEEQAKESRPKKNLGWMEGVRHRLLGSKGGGEAAGGAAAASEPLDQAALNALAGAVSQNAGAQVESGEPGTALARVAPASKLARIRRAGAAKAKGASAAPGR
ncbi:MAG: hypothetical protein IPJ98_15860 [Bryobacterales bacterium]|nr:hypothetical protein [Bryobacterales bacterium]